MQWHTVFGLGSLTIHVGAVPLEFTGVSGPGGVAVVHGLRQHVAAKDRQVREGILAMAARFKAPVSAPAPNVFPDEVPETYFLNDSEPLPQMR